MAAHEIGHALGLWHSNDIDALMHPNATSTRTRHLAQDDILAIQQLYGNYWTSLSKLTFSKGHSAAW